MPNPFSDDITQMIREHMIACEKLMETLFNGSREISDADKKDVENILDKNKDIITKIQEHKSELANFQELINELNLYEVSLRPTIRLKLSRPGA
jgi:hypothetical protein